MSKCLAPKRTRSRRFIQSYPASWTITAQFTPSLSHTPPPSSRTPDVATGCQRIYTSHARPRTPTPLCRQVHVHSHTHLRGHKCGHTSSHTHRRRLGGTVKICSDHERRHGTQHAYNVQCHDNSEKLPSPSSPTPGSHRREVGDS